MYALVQLQFGWSMLVSISDIRKRRGFSGIPRFIPQANSTPPDQFDVIGLRNE